MGDIISALVFLVLVFGFIALMTVLAGRSSSSSSTRTTHTTIRCPTCGAQARVRGNTWECGWCGDSGYCQLK